MTKNLKLSPTSLSLSQFEKSRRLSFCLNPNYSERSKLSLSQNQKIHFSPFISAADGVLVSQRCLSHLTAALTTHFGFEALCHFNFLAVPPSVPFLIRSFGIWQPSWIGYSGTSFLRLGLGQLAFIGFYPITTVGPRQGGLKTEVTFLKRRLWGGKTIRPNFNFCQCVFISLNCKNLQFSFRKSNFSTGPVIV